MTFVNFLLLQHYYLMLLSNCLIITWDNLCYKGNKDHKRKRVINDKTQTELLELSHTFTLRDAENVMKMVVLQRDMTHSTDMHRLIALAADERASKRETHELAIKKLDHELEMKKLDLEMLRLSQSLTNDSRPVTPAPTTQMQTPITEQTTHNVFARVSTHHERELAGPAQTQSQTGQTIPVRPTDSQTVQPTSLLTQQSGVWQVDRYTGQRIAVFATTKKAAMTLTSKSGANINNMAQSISKCIRGIIPSYMGYKWERDE